MKYSGFCLVIVLFFTLCGIATAYDNFSTDLLDISNWSTHEEVTMHLPSGKLLSEARSTQQGEYNRPYFTFASPSSIYSIKTEVTVQKISLTQNSNSNAEAEARLHGFFYNTMALPTSYMGNVWACVALTDRGNGLEAYWIVEEILDAQITMSEIMGKGTLVGPGSLNTGAVYILELEYDEPQSQFRFAIYDQTNVLLGSGQYNFSNRMAPAYSPFVGMGSIAYNDVAMVSAVFDNVYTKSSPSGAYTLYDDCSSYSLSKWNEPQIGRYISDGKLVSMVQSTGNRETNDLRFNGDPDYIEAKVRVSSESDIPEGGTGLARINGYYFNDTKPPSLQTGYAGNVWAFIRLRLRGNQLDGGCYVGKSLSDDESEWEDFWYQSFDQINFQLDTTYTLSIDFTGVSFVFEISDGVNSQAHTYMIPAGTPVYEAYKGSRSLRTRAMGDAGGGTIKATFDNIRTFALPDGWETVSGSVKVGDTDACALVLVNGQSMFTCGANQGRYEMDVPLDANGNILVQAFVSGQAPFRETSDISQLDVDIALQAADPESQEPSVTTTIDTQSVEPGWARISGTITFEGTPLCSLALANGQNMFTCGDNNGVYDLTVPLNESGQIVFFVFVAGLQPYQVTLTP